MTAAKQVKTLNPEAQRRAADLRMRQHDAVIISEWNGGNPARARSAAKAAITKRLAAAKAERQLRKKLNAERYQNGRLDNKSK